MQFSSFAISLQLCMYFYLLLKMSLKKMCKLVLMRKIKILISLALYSKKGEAWPLGHIVQQSWQKQALPLAVPKVEVKRVS